MVWQELDYCKSHVSLGFGGCAACLSAAMVTYHKGGAPVSHSLSKVLSKSSLTFDILEGHGGWETYALNNTRMTPTYVREGCLLCRGGFSLIVCRSSSILLCAHESLEVEGRMLHRVRGHSKLQD